MIRISRSVIKSLRTALCIVVPSCAIGASSDSAWTLPLTIPRARAICLVGVNVADPDLAKAIADGQRAIAKEPTSPASWLRLGMIYDIHAQFPQAVGCYSQAVRLSPGNLWATYLVAFALDQAGEPLSSVAPAYRHTIRQAPQYGPARLRLAEVLFKFGKFQEAHAAFDDALRTYPASQSARARRGLGLLRLASGDTAGGVAMLESVLLLRTDDGPTWGGLSRGYQLLGRGSDASSAAQRSNGLEDRLGYFDEWRLPVLEEAVMPVLVEERINAKVGMGRPEDAMADALRWERKHPDWPSIKRLIGNLYRRLGREELAQQYFDAAKQTASKKYNK